MFFYERRNWLSAIRSCSRNRIWLILKFRVIIKLRLGRKLYIELSWCIWFRFCRSSSKRLLSDISFLYNGISWFIIVKFNVFFWFERMVFFVRVGCQILISHSFIRESVIWVRSSFELRHLLILLLFVSKSNLLSVGILRSWELVRISLFVFVDRCSMCLVFLVRVLDSWLIFFWGREQIWRKYLIAGERIVLNNLDMCIGRSFLNLIRWVNWFILLVMILIVGLDKPFLSKKIPKYLIVSSSLRGRIC